MEKKRMVINGASGRIGRQMTYEAFRESSLEVALLNDLVPIDALVHNFTRRDSTHGTLPWSVTLLDDRTININDKKILVYHEKDPSRLPLRNLGITYVQECSGFFDGEKGNPHAFLEAGAQRVIMSYPAKVKDITLVAGVNHFLYNPEKHRLISNGSCTTKALVAPLRLLMDYSIEIVSCMMNTVHAATNSQHVLDFGDRYATLNQICTAKTGAAKAAAEVIPELKDRLGGLAYRVPTTDGSITDISLVVKSLRELDAKDINDLFVEHAGDAKYLGRIAIHEEKEIASADIIGRTENAIVVPSKTQVHSLGSMLYHVRMVCGYDNEMGPPKDQIAVSAYMASREFQHG